VESQVAVVWRSIVKSTGQSGRRGRCACRVAASRAAGRSIDEVDYRTDDESIEVSAVVALVGLLPVAQQVEVDGSE
jgi:hypothetical protein